MSLIGSSRTITNATMRARVSAAVRQTAPGKVPAEGAPGRLAQQALTDPDSLVPHFLSRVAVDDAVAAASCSDCGHAAVDDEVVLFIVNAAWDEVAGLVFPATA